MGTKLAALGMAAAITVGGFTVAAINPLSVAGAQDGAATATQEAPTREGPLQRALDKLVADKTLTQAQADAVLDATKSEAKAGREQRKADRKARHAETLGVIAEALGTTPAQVKAGLTEGTSVAEQAKAGGVDRQVVDDALTAHLNGRIDAAVQAGKLTEERAAKAKEHVDGAVDRILDADGSRLRGRRGN